MERWKAAALKIILLTLNQISKALHYTHSTQSFSKSLLVNKIAALFIFCLSIIYIVNKYKCISVQNAALFNFFFK